MPASTFPARAKQGEPADINPVNPKPVNILSSPEPAPSENAVVQVPWQVARDAWAYPRGDTEADDWAGVVSAVLAHATRQRARDGFVEVAGDLLARTAEILEQHDHKALPFALRAALAGAQNDAATS